MCIQEGRKAKEKKKGRNRGGKYFSTIRHYWQERTKIIARIYERKKPMALSSRSNTSGVDALYCVGVNYLYLLSFFDSVVDSYINQYISVISFHSLTYNYSSFKTTIKPHPPNTLFLCLIIWEQFFLKSLIFCIAQSKSVSSE